MAIGLHSNHEKEACWLRNGSNKGPTTSLDYFILFWMARMYFQKSKVT
jgi:hypothetical protein